MTDHSEIECHGVTAMVDRNGRRVRFYKRAEPSRPGQQTRRKMAARGLKWCSGCEGWLPAPDVTPRGKCRPCWNREDRERYRSLERHREERKAHAQFRKRGVDRMPSYAKELILELFDGLCAYCDEAGTTWDHFHPITKGGKTEPGNMIPCCGPCNSRKRAKDPLSWLESLPSVKPFTVEYLTTMGVLHV